MKVHFSLIEPGKQGMQEDFFYLHQASREKRHQIVDHPSEADLIILLGEWIPELHLLTHNQVLSKFRHKCAVYYDGGHYLPIVPGVYDSATPGMHTRLGMAKTSCYVMGFGSLRNEGVKFQPEIPKKWLFSFRGGSTSFVRKKLYKCRFNREDVIIEDTAAITTGSRIRETGRSASGPMGEPSARAISCCVPGVLERARSGCLK